MKQFQESGTRSALLRCSLLELSSLAPQPQSLVIEVSVSSLRYDREVKLPYYAAAGVPELWIVDVRHRRVELYTDPDRRSRRYSTARILTYGETLRPAMHRRVAIAVRDLLPAPRRRRRSGH